MKKIIVSLIFGLEEDICDGETPEILGKHMIDLLNIIKHFE